MYNLYLVTGATGYLGSTVVKKLAAAGAAVRVFVMPGDRLAKNIPDGVQVCFGSVDNRESLNAFFDGAGENACVIHCAGIVSIASQRDERLWNVNVVGTENITDLCTEHEISKLVYVSSVHAIPEKEKGQQIDEYRNFSPEKVVGDYAKSKAAATAYVLRAAELGLNASVVHPSGIIGPFDSGDGSITGTVIAYCNGKLSAGVTGGYDFVDVRDVADGVISCTEKGKKGECYILSGRYVSVKEVLTILKELTGGKRILFCAPLGIVKIFAPMCEKNSIKKETPLFLTPYSVYTMGVNSWFSHQKATDELNYSPRPIEKTLADMVKWLTVTGRIKPKQPWSLQGKAMGRKKYIYSK